ncbi:carbamate kinase [Carboxydothermus islandicus]|uniref:Carbamate kinase n=1 Tax=Carboxydothermus islandicus TaxID=661089 RepID=A0A1L8D3D7_9THEO|nr:carbamate kinase [Carboxydothermus islandicus]GAV25692.1 carbamate kinase [Carboxydothermus islandicus]
MATLVLAIGGNAITKPNEKGTFAEQVKNIRKVTDQLVELVAKGHRLVLVHGNGPQVGNLLIKNELAKEVVPAMPLYVCVSNTQGSLGLGLQQQLKNSLKKAGIDKDIITMITQVVVDPNDLAFTNPTKPIGPFYTEEEAKKLIAQQGYHMVEDSGRGWRRVVPSPVPLRIVEARAIKKALEQDMIVVAAGGGGIPVMEKDGELYGVDGVIDKDLAALKLALEVNADILFLLTGVPKVAINFGKPNEKQLDKMTVEEAEQYYREGHFPPGSMGPKIRAAIDFVKAGGKKAVIGLLEEALSAVEGKAGTTITR